MLARMLLPAAWSTRRVERRRAALLRRIVGAEATWRTVDDDALRRAGLGMRWRARGGAFADDAIVDAFALVREAARRAYGQPHYATQLLAGLVLVDGALAEMQTGEGKTLAALLPAFVQGLAGEGCHVVTANDYLAQRDAEFARGVLGRLGMTVGCVVGDLPYAERRPQYDRDVTYAAARELGFDFLRDRLANDAAKDLERGVQRARHFALVDEADSVLIDDARTPLVIAVEGAASEPELEFFRWCDDSARKLDAEAMTLDATRRTVRLTQAGCRRVLASGRLPAWAGAAPERVFHQVEQSLAAHRLLRRGRDYVVDDRGVGIVDPSTGRVAEGRKWRDGLQQAVEVKERLQPSASTAVAARISVQSFFRGYARLAGMTGTAWGCRRELAHAYSQRVTALPTRLPSLRQAAAPRVFSTSAAKVAAVAATIAARVARGQAVLAGTPSVEASEQLAAGLAAAGVEHAVLNCLRHRDEAALVAQAGQPGRVTIATNMAGRGTDIAVAPAVLAAGGLHVIVTQMHASARIDRQLIGRAARQGEPGSYEFSLSLDDEILTEFPHRGFQRARADAQRAGASELGAHWLRWFHRAQRWHEAHQRRERRMLLAGELARTRAFRDLGLDPVLEAVEN